MIVTNRRKVNFYTHVVVTSPQDRSLHCRIWGHRERSFPSVCSASFWAFFTSSWNSRACKPETKSRVCITVKNSPNPSCVYIRLCKRRKTVFSCFYKTTFPRKKAKLFCLEHGLKEKFLPVAKSCTRSLYA